MPTVTHISDYMYTLRYNLIKDTWWEYVWGGLKTPIYIIGPKGSVARGESGDIEDNDKHFLRYGEIGFVADVKARSFIQTALALIYGFQNVISLSSDQVINMRDIDRDKILRSDIILMGGAIANPIYKDYFIYHESNSYNDIKHIFDSKEEQNIEYIKEELISVMSMTIGGRDFHTITSKSEPARIYQDHGVFAKRVNMYNEERHVYFIAGYRAPGTKAAAAISVCNAMDELYQKRKEDNALSNSITVVAMILGSGNSPIIDAIDENLIKMVYPIESADYSNEVSVKEQNDLLLDNMIKVVSKGHTKDPLDEQIAGNDLNSIIDELVRSDEISNQRVQELIRNNENGFLNTLFDKTLSIYRTRDKVRIIKIKKIWGKITEHYGKDSNKTKIIYKKLGSQIVSKFSKELDSLFEDLTFGFLGIGSLNIGYKIAKENTKRRMEKRGMKFIKDP